MTRESIFYIFKLFKNLCAEKFKDVEVLRVSEPIYSPDRDPLSSRVFFVDFGDKILNKQFRIAYRIKDFEKISKDIDCFEDVFKQQYEHWLLTEGGPKAEEDNLTPFYRLFCDGRGECYDKIYKIFFTACKLLEKYKDLHIIPREHTRLLVPQQIGTIGYTGHKFKVAVYSNDASMTMPEFDFNFPPELFNTQPLPKDDENLKPLLGKVDGITYAATRIMLDIGKQLKYGPRYYF